MTKLPTLKPKEVIAILKKADYYIDHVTGSHYIMRHPERRHHIAIPYYVRDVKRGVLHSIIKQSRMSQEEFLSLH